jgi:hypothetical protein
LQCTFKSMARRLAAVDCDRNALIHVDLEDTVQPDAGAQLPCGAAPSGVGDVLQVPAFAVASSTRA